MAVKRKSKKKVGRPKALDETKKKEIIAFINAGGSKVYAAKYVGVDPATIIREEQADEAFRNSLTHAEATSYKNHIMNVSKAGQDDWRASAWFLERKFHQEFGKKDQLQMKVEGVRVAGGDRNERIETAKNRVLALANTRSEN